MLSTINQTTRNSETKAEARQHLHVININGDHHQQHQSTEKNITQVSNMNNDVDNLLLKENN